MRTASPGAVYWAFLSICAALTGCDADDTEPAQDAAAPTMLDGSVGRPDALMDASLDVDAARDAAGDAAHDAAVSCTVQAPTACPEPAPRYADVAPVIAARCASCHRADWAGPWPLNSYRHVSDWADDIRGRLLNCTMPPPEAQVPMTDDERLVILSWIRCGMPR